MSGAAVGCGGPDVRVLPGMSDHALHLRRVKRLSAHSTQPSGAVGQLVAAGLFAGATATAALVGGLVTASSMAWYDGLDLPSYAPPDRVFGPVWSVLYSMVAVAGFLMWRSTTRPLPTVMWALSMLLNLSWTLVFFGLRAPEAAIAVIAVLLASIVALVVMATRHHRPVVAWLLVPYAAWVGFASVLNVAIAGAN